MNIIVHNVKESTAEDGSTRKQQDIEVVTSLFQQHLDISPSISRAFCLGQKHQKPRPLKITVSSDAEKASILCSSIKFRDQDKPDEVKDVFVTLDLTPKEQETSKKLCAELRELNKDGRMYQIKNGVIVEKKS